MRVLVTGASGQLGIDCSVAFADDDVILAGRDRIDLTQPSSVRLAVAEIRPDVVVNCAAYTAVDRAESDSEMAFVVNGDGARAVALGCVDAGARMIHISTDYVYDGTQLSPYVEGDATNPVSVYGRSKLAGDLAVGEVLGDQQSTIVRTSWVCGAHGSNMVKTVLRLMAMDPKRTLTFVDDQFGHPTFTSGLAEKIREIALAELGGLFHVTHQGAVSWYEFVGEILEAAGYSRDQVQPISTIDLMPARPAVRPMNSVLDNARLSALGVELLPDFREVLPGVVSAIQSAS